MNTIHSASGATTPGGINELSQVNSQPQDTTGSGIDRLANKEIFMQLLVAQLKNQNPLNPADGTEFVAQLAQFTQLEQTLAMRQELERIRTVVEGQTDGGAQATP